MLKPIRAFALIVGAFILSTSTFANLPYHPIEFPRDDAGHYQNTPYSVSNMMEWWYYNGLVTSTTGEKFGFYLSFNYMYLAPNKMVPFIQLQVTDIANQKVYGKQVYFTDPNTYKISTVAPLYVAYGKNFTLEKVNNQYHVEAAVDSTDGVPLRISFTFTPKRPMLLMGDNGLVDMWNNKNSYYYSYTELATSGYLSIGKDIHPLNEKKSLSWMDHQWGDFFIVPGKNQWLWTSIQLTNGLDINLGVIFDAKTKKPSHGTPTILMPDGSKRVITDINRVSFTPYPVKPGQKHATKYDIVIKDLDLHLTLDALVPGQDKNGIWEGISAAYGTYQGKRVTGQATSENMLK